jgi:hypothetical protein
MLARALTGAQRAWTVTVVIVYALAIAATLAFLAEGFVSATACVASGRCVLRTADEWNPYQ